MTVTNRDLKIICCAHGAVVKNVLNLLFRKGWTNKQVFYDNFDGSYDETLTGADGRGYRLEPYYEATGQVSVRVIPGHFKRGIFGRSWQDDPRDALLTDDERRHLMGGN